MKVGIIRCDEHSADCAGFHCFPAIRDKSGQFQNYDLVELVGFDTCGGCGRGSANKIMAKALRLRERGAEVIHLGNCLAPCPSKEMYEAALKKEMDIPIVSGTHTAPARH